MLLLIYLKLKCKTNALVNINKVQRHAPYMAVIINKDFKYTDT